jgi:hypothetical protein
MTAGPSMVFEVSGTDEVFKKRKIDAVAFKGLAADIVDGLSVGEERIQMLEEPIGGYGHDHLLEMLTASSACLIR